MKLPMGWLLHLHPSVCVHGSMSRGSQDGGLREKKYVLICMSRTLVKLFVVVSPCLEETRCLKLAEGNVVAPLLPQHARANNAHLWIVGRGGQVHISTVPEER